MKFTRIDLELGTGDRLWWDNRNSRLLVTDGKQVYKVLFYTTDSMLRNSGRVYTLLFGPYREDMDSLPWKEYVKGEGFDYYRK